MLRHGVLGAAARGAPRPGRAQRAHLARRGGQGGGLRAGQDRPPRGRHGARQTTHQVDRPRGTQVQC